MTMPSRGALLVAGASSGAGKSTVAAGLCRLLARRGLAVAPFKAQNLSNHSAVTADGGEIGRAQAMQASAACVEPDRRMNPVLLKPGSGSTAHMVVLGDEATTSDAEGYGDVAAGLKRKVLDALESLRRDYSWVVAEGAGGAAEINLLERDLVNLPLAAAAGINSILVVDIDRGGAFAAAHGTIDLLPAPLRERVGGIVFNRFTGDPTLLDSGIAELEKRSGVPVLGVLPHLGDRPMLGVEDSLDMNGSSRLVVPRSPDPVRVTAVALPHLANPSDLDPFALEPDVVLTWARSPHDLIDADLVVLPGSRATVADLDWLRGTGIAGALAAVAEAGRARIVGVCAGYQMLGERIDDPVESGMHGVVGLGLLRSTTRFERPKIVQRSHGSCNGHAVDGYQIRFGRLASNERPWLELDGVPEGAISSAGPVFGTSLHGIFDSDGFRSALLAEVAAQRGRLYEPPGAGFSAAVEAQHERLADWLEANADVERMLALGSSALPAGEGPGW